MPVRLTVLAILAASCLVLCGGCSNKHPEQDYSFTDPRVLTLLAAVDREDLPEIDRLVAAGVDVNAVGQSIAFPGALDATPLTWAFPEKKAAFERLLQLGADPDRCGNRSVTMLAAAVENDPDWLRLVLEHQGNPNLVGPLGVTPLFFAVSSRRLDNLKLLIDAVADIDRRNAFGFTPIIQAAEMPWFEGVYWLLEAGADYRLGDAPNHDLTYYVVAKTVEDGNDQWQSREKVIDFLDAKGVDFEPACKLVEEETPDAAKLWKQEMQRRAEEKEKRRGKPE